MSKCGGNWTTIPQSKGYWFAGIFVIRVKASGACYVVGTSNVGKRFWDHKKWLNTGKHPCKQLQALWSADPTVFEFLLAERVKVRWLLSYKKQFLIDQLRKNGACLNAQNSIRKKRKRRPVPLVLLRIDLREPPARPVEGWAKCIFNSYKEAITLAKDQNLAGYHQHLGGDICAGAKSAIGFARRAMARAEAALASGFR